MTGPRLALESLRRAASLLSSERSLWLWAAMPALANGVAVLAGVGLFLAYGLEPISSALHAMLSVSDPEAWYGWLWVAPVRLLAWLARWGVLGLFFVLLYVFLVLFAGLVAAPFLEVLSRRVEQLATGRVIDVGEGGTVAFLTASARALGAEARRVAWFVGVQLCVLAVGLVPGLQPLAAALGLSVAAAFLPLDYAGYLLDRRGADFRERRRWLAAHPTSLFAFGAAALATFGVPLLNFVCLPWLVTAATLLALEVGPPLGATAVAEET